VLEAGSKFRFLIQFNQGQPVTPLTYTLYNQDGDVVTTDTIAITPTQISYTVEIAGSFNSLSKPLFEQMRLEWQYNTADQAILDSVTYTIRAPIPFPVSEANVRKMLGVDLSELPDSDVDLFAAYLNFKNKFEDPTLLDAYGSQGSLDAYKLTMAIEATAALSVFPTLAIRLPKKYDSGTSSYERWNTIDWELLYSDIASRVTDGLSVIDPNLELFPVTDIFTLSDRGTDQITGA
jgi:hypothetical protein